MRKIVAPHDVVVKISPVDRGGRDHGKVNQVECVLTERPETIVKVASWLEAHVSRDLCRLCVDDISPYDLLDSA